MPSAAVKFPSEPPPVAALLRARTRCPPRTARAVSKRRTTPAERSIGGRLKPPLTSRRAPGVRAASARIARSIRIGVGHGLGADVHRRGGEVGHHVGPRAAGDDADVDRDAAIEVADRVHRQHLQRQLADGVDALARIHAGVRGHAVDGQLVLADALAAVLSAPPASAGSSTSTASLCRGLGFDQRARGVAAGLLVGGPQHGDARVGGRRQIHRAPAWPACRARCRPSCRGRRARAGARLLRETACGRAARSATPCRSGRCTSTCRDPGAEAGQQMIARRRSAAPRVTAAADLREAARRAPRRSDPRPPCRRSAIRWRRARG